MPETTKDQLAQRIQRAGWHLATAESMTAGLVASAAAQAPDASEWLLGGVVAYSTEVKHKLLGVDLGPVVNAETAAQMARGAADLLGAEVAVATTGVGGPDPQEGEPAGTVFVGIYVDGRVTTHRLDLDGDPGDVCEGAAERALELVADALSE